MILIVGTREERELLERLRKLQPEDRNSVSTLTAELIALKNQIATLEIDKSKRQEAFEKGERELRHMVGLERKRQEAEREQQKVELDQSKKAATLDLREANLVADRQRFDEQLKFNTERFETMEKYLKDMMANILDRLPNINVKMKGSV